jgi:hypothetical protein
MKWVMLVLWVATGQLDASFSFETEAGCRRAVVAVEAGHGPMVRAKCIELVEKPAGVS